MVNSHPRHILHLPKSVHRETHGEGLLAWFGFPVNPPEGPTCPVQELAFPAKAFLGGNGSDSGF